MFHVRREGRIGEEGERKEGGKGCATALVVCLQLLCCDAVMILCFVMLLLLLLLPLLLLVLPLLRSLLLLLPRSRVRCRFLPYRCSPLWPVYVRVWCVCMCVCVCSVRCAFTSSSTRFNDSVSAHCVYNCTYTRDSACMCVCACVCVVEKEREKEREEERKRKRNQEKSRIIMRNQEKLREREKKWEGNLALDLVAAGDAVAELASLVDQLRETLQP